MILTLKKLIQKSKQVIDPRDAHALALDLVESMLRHYAVVAIAAYRHAGAKDPKVNRILSDQLPRPSMGSWKNFLQVLAASDKELFPEGFRDKFLAPLTKKVSNSEITGVCAGLRRLADQDVFALSESPVPPDATPCTPLEFLDAVVTYRNRFAGHGTHELPDSALQFALAFLNGTAALCSHLNTLWLACPMYVANKSKLSGREFFRLQPLVEGIEELRLTASGIHEERLYLCFGDKQRPESESLYPLALWHEEDILFANGTKDLCTIHYLGFINHQSFETDIYADDFRAFLVPFIQKEETVWTEPDSSDREKRPSSIAVLAFDDMSSQKDQEWFCDGMAEEIINTLTQIESIRVAARKSAFYFKGKETDIREIGEKLSVETVLEGSIRKAGNRIRVTAQLIKVKDGYHLWSRQYDRDLEDIFEVQSDVARNIAEALTEKLTPEEKQQIEQRPTQNVEAYTLYMRGINYFYRGYEKSDLFFAEKMFRDAIQLDPAFAHAYGWLSMVHTNLYWFYYDRTKERLELAKECADKSIRINPRLSITYGFLGMYYMQIPDFDAALDACKTAIQLAPNSGEALALLGIVYRWRGKLDLSAQYLEKVCQLDPLFHMVYFECEFSHMLQRNYLKAEEYLEKGIQLAPETILPYWGRSMLCLTWKGDIPRARFALSEAPGNIETILQIAIGFGYNLYPLGIIDGNYEEALIQLSQVSGDSFENVLFFSTKAQLEAQIYGLMGNEQRMQERYEIARDIIKDLMKNDPDNPRYHSALGIVCAGLGLKEKAIMEGERAVELKDLKGEMWKGIGRVEDLARIYTMTGEYEKALDTIEYLLSQPGILSPALLRIHPDWKPLYGQPRFEAILAK